MTITYQIMVVVWPAFIIGTIFAAVFLRPLRNSSNGGWLILGGLMTVALCMAVIELENARYTRLSKSFFVLVAIGSVGLCFYVRSLHRAFVGQSVGPAKCEQCGYMLHGNTSGTCPECGKSIEGE